MCSCVPSPPPLSLTLGSSAHTHDGEIEKEIRRPRNKNDGRMSGNETAARSTRERGETEMRGRRKRKEERPEERHKIDNSGEGTTAE